MKIASVMVMALTVSLLGCSVAQVQPTTPGPVPVTVEVPAGMGSAPFDVQRQLTVPAGYGIEVYARIDRARFMRVTPDGHVLVSQPSGGRIKLMRKTGDTTTVTDFASGLNQPHDMVFVTAEGKTWLYVAEATRITRTVYQNGDLTLGTPEVLLDNLPTGGHSLKNIAIGGGKLYVSIASATNEDPIDLQGDPKRASIYVYDLDGKNGRLFATGIRNAEGLDFAPDTGALWAVVNNRDNIQYPYHKDFDGDGSDDYGKVLPGYVDDNPPEEFIEVKDGADYGWPYCNPVLNPTTGFENMPFVPDVTRNPEGKVKDCSKMTPIDQGLQAHSAPLGLSFWTGEKAPAEFRNGAVTGLHGSWNRTSFSGHKVSFFPWKDGQPLQEQELVSGWVTDAVNKVRWGRPVDAVPLPDGSLLISDDFSGTVYRLYKK